MSLERLERMVGRPKVEEIVEAFLEHSPKRIEDLRDALRRSDTEAAALALHSLHASAAMLGATPLADVARRLEQAARRSDLRAVRDGHAALEAAYRAAAASLGSFRPDA